MGERVLSMFSTRNTSLAFAACLFGIVWCFARPVVAQAQRPDPRFSRPVSLEVCIDIALEHNLELRIAHTKQQQARAVRGQAMGIYWPDITFFGEYSDLNWYGEREAAVQKLRIGNTLLTEQLPTGGRIEANYIVSHDWGLDFKVDTRLVRNRSDLPVKELRAGIIQPILRGGGWLAGTGGVKDANYEVKIASADLEAVRLTVIAQVKTSYYEVIRQTKLVQVNKEAIKRDIQLVLHSKSKLEAGLATRRDQLSAEIVQAQDEGRLADAETERNHALDQLARAMGVPVGTAIELAQQDVDIDPIEIREKDWIAKAMRDNPLIASARLAEERSELAMRLARNGRLPQVDFGIFYRTFRDNDANKKRKLQNDLQFLQGDLPDPLKPTSFDGWTYQLTFNLPIGNKILGNAYKNTQWATKASKKIRQDVEEQMIADIRAAVRNLENSTLRLTILDKEMEGARDKLEFATINFQLGRSTNLDVTDAQKDLRDAETDYVNKVVDYLIGLAQIEALVGGL